jgi:3alpha(or 20beta)-hydroxysteroid dehydrogenase
MNRLTGKVAIITGAAGGQGAAEARLLVNEGASVVLTDMITDGAAIAQELGERALFLKHDVSNELEWQDVVNATIDRFDRLDVLVNNAGVFQPATIDQTSVETFDLHYRVNQLGVFLGMRAVIDPLSKSGGGSIINISSGLAMRVFPGRIAYTGSKWAVRGLTRAAALELATFNIRVNAIMPGVIDTPMLGDNNTELREQLSAMVPLGRLGRSEEIAEMVAYLASDQSSYVTGSEIVIDGGVAA